MTCCKISESEILLTGGFKEHCEGAILEEPEETSRKPSRDCIIFDTRTERISMIRGFKQNLIPVFAHAAGPGVAVQLVLDETNRDLLLLKYTSEDREVDLIHRLELSRNSSR